MEYTTFAAIDIGSYHVVMEIFEISKTQGMRSIYQVRQRLELGKDAYSEGKITPLHRSELCKILKDYKNIMKEYRVEAYRACSTSSLREVRNAAILQEYIFLKTHLKVEILSNSEQRFLSYKSIAAKETEFLTNIEKGTAIIDLGGGSLQISLFDKDSLITTQNIKLGNLRIRERLSHLEHNTTHYERLVEELIHSEIYNFKKMHLKYRQIHNVILLGDYFADAIAKGNDVVSKNMSYEDFLNWYNKIRRRSKLDLAVDFKIPMEYASLLIPSAVIYKSVIEILGADTIWTPGVQLVDGIAYNYALEQGFLVCGHDFENDIYMSARNIGKRYASSKPHVANVDLIATTVFDCIKEEYGLNDRARLLLRIAIMLHDCGKYISLVEVSVNSANIIRATEIIGLSHMERDMIANIVKYNHQNFDYFEEFAHASGLSMECYLLVAKLTAIFKLANAMDRSHLQKVISINATLEEHELRLAVDTKSDYSLENGLLQDKVEFFQEVYHITPIVNIKRL